MVRICALLILIATLTSALGGGPATSGLRVGDEVAAWEPIHEAGPHAGTKTCPVCAYLEAPVLLAFAKDTATADKLAGPLEAIAAAHGKGKLKVILVVVNGSSQELQALAKSRQLKNLMLCRPDPERRDQQLRTYKVNPAQECSVILYEDYQVKSAWLTLTPAVGTVTDRYLPKR